jgi:hypothetical protein
VKIARSVEAAGSLKNTQSERARLQQYQPRAEKKRSAQCTNGED